MNNLYRKVEAGYNLLVDRTGESYLTNEGYKITIIDYRRSNDCDIIFEDGLILNNKSFVAIKKGNIKNPLHKGVYGVGYFGIGKYKSRVNKILTKAHCIWFSMMKRCYDKKSIDKNPTYKNVTVCDEWHNFQNFAKWYYENWKEYMDSEWQLDKDFLSENIKIYSPETCCFLPREINNILQKKINSNSLPKGVYFRKDTEKYSSNFRIKKISKGLGSYNTIDKAFEAYKKEKESHIKLIAEKYKNIIPDKVFNKLYNYVVKPYDKESPPRIKINNPRMFSEDIDMTYANSPYYIYRPENI